MVSDDVTGKLTLAKYDNKNARHAREESGVVFITMLYYHHNTNEIEKMISRLSSGEDLSSTDRTTMEMVEKQRNRHWVNNQQLQHIKKICDYNTHPVCIHEKQAQVPETGGAKKNQQIFVNLYQKINKEIYKVL